MKWIRIEDELPPLYEKILVYSKHALHFENYSLTQLMQDVDGNVSFRDNRYFNPPTHWCSLTRPRNKK